MASELWGRPFEMELSFRQAHVRFGSKADMARYGGQTKTPARDWGFAFPECEAISLSPRWCRASRIAGTYYCRTL